MMSVTVRRSANTLSFVLLASVALPLGAQPVDQICIRNQTPERLFLAVDTDMGRVTKPVGPDRELCGPVHRKGFVTAFPSRDALEGCSRLVEPGMTANLDAYRDFDRCAWSHTKLEN